MRFSDRASANLIRPLPKVSLKIDGSVEVLTFSKVFIKEEVVRDPFLMNYAAILRRCKDKEPDVTEHHINDLRSHFQRAAAYFRSCSGIPFQEYTTQNEERFLARPRVVQSAIQDVLRNSEFYQSHFNFPEWCAQKGSRWCHQDVGLFNSIWVSNFKESLRKWPSKRDPRIGYNLFRFWVNGVMTKCRTAGWVDHWDLTCPFCGQHDDRIEHWGILDGFQCPVVKEFLSSCNPPLSGKDLVLQNGPIDFDAARSVSALYRAHSDLLHQEATDVSDAVSYIWSFRVHYQGPTKVAPPTASVKLLLGL